MNIQDAIAACAAAGIKYYPPKNRVIPTGIDDHMVRINGRTMPEIHASTHPDKLLPGTIEFLKEMRAEVNAGFVRRGEKDLIRPWTEADEARY